MKSEWESLALSDFCNYRQERISVDSLILSDFISTANMLPNKGGISVAENLPNTNTTSRFYKNDVLISNIRPYFKKSWLATKDGGCSNDILVMESKEDVDFTYLYYLLSSDDFFAYMTATSKGTKMPRGDKDAIMMYKALKPSLPTQKAIADTLSCLDAKIELNNKINENLEAQAQAIFKSWFVDFEPFQDGEFVESELGLIPKGWEVRKLEDVINVRYGKDHKALIDGNIPVYGSGGIMRYVNTSLYEEETVLIPRKGTLNNVMLINHPFWSVDTMFYTEIKISNFAKYLYHFLKLKDLASMNVGSAVPSMTTALLNEMELVLPTDKILSEYENIMKRFYQMKQSCEHQNTTLAALRDTLLPKLMSGEVEVPVTQ